MGAQDVAAAQEDDRRRHPHPPHPGPRHLPVSLLQRRQLLQELRSPTFEGVVSIRLTKSSGCDLFRGLYRVEIVDSMAHAACLIGKWDDEFTLRSDETGIRCNLGLSWLF